MLISINVATPFIADARTAFADARHIHVCMYCAQWEWCVNLYFYFRDLVISSFWPLPLSIPPIL